MSFLVVKGGLLTSVQDLGRAGYQRYGVVVGGASDPFAARVANALVGNVASAAVLELALVGPELRFDSEALLAWCGADFDARVDGVPLPPNRPARAAPGTIVAFVAVRRGARAWLAISGGIDVPLVLGSRSTCRRFGFGGLQGRALAAGDRLRIGVGSPWAQRICASLRVAGRIHCDWSVSPGLLGHVGESGKLRALRGPEWDWFNAEAQGRFFGAAYRVTKEADRMGVRLEGPALDLLQPCEMISSAVNVGVVQAPPGGQPIVLLCSRQTVGGYPRLAAVAAVESGRLAQLKQGDEVGFEEIELGRAHQLYLERERDFTLAREALSRRTS